MKKIDRAVFSVMKYYCATNEPNIFITLNKI